MENLTINNKIKKYGFLIKLNLENKPKNESINDYLNEKLGFRNFTVNVLNENEKNANVYIMFHNTMFFEFLNNIDNYAGPDDIYYCKECDDDVYFKDYVGAECNCNFDNWLFDNYQFGDFQFSDLNDDAVDRLLDAYAEYQCDNFISLINDDQFLNFDVAKTLFFSYWKLELLAINYID